MRQGKDRYASSALVVTDAAKKEVFNMRIKIVREGKSWRNNQNGETVEVYTIYTGLDYKVKYERGLCGTGVMDVLGFILTPGQSAILDITIHVLQAVESERSHGLPLPM
jgi:hypothetical protein